MSGSGYEVVDAESPEQAVLMMESHCDIDLLVTDVVMPNETDAYLASQLTKKKPGLRVLFMSGYEAGGGMQSAFLQKPFRSGAARRVREILAEQMAPLAYARGSVRTSATYPRGRFPICPRTTLRTESPASVTAARSGAKSAATEAACSPCAGAV